MNDAYVQGFMDKLAEVKSAARGTQLAKVLQGLSESNPTQKKELMELILKHKPKGRFLGRLFPPKSELLNIGTEVHGILGPGPARSVYSRIDLPRGSNAAPAVAAKLKQLRAVE